MAQVGVDDADDRRALAAAKPSTTAVPRPSLPARWMTLMRWRRRELVGERAGAVGRVVVDDDQLAVEPVALVGRENGRTSSSSRSRSL